MEEIDKPFQLAVESLPNASYALTVSQRPFPASRDGLVLPFVNRGHIDGLALLSAWDLVLDALRMNQYKPIMIQHVSSKRFELNEESGVRLSLLFKVIAPLSNLDHIRALQQATWAISNEEAYYWFAKCCGPNGRQGVRAFRLLYGPIEAEWLQVVAE
jgi:hypothetical protein